MDWLVILMLTTLQSISIMDPSLCCSQLPTVTACIDDISSWMFFNRLKINMDKTRFIWLGSPQQLAKLNVRTITVADVDIEVSDNVTCLGVVLDSTLTFAHCIVLYCVVFGWNDKNHHTTHNL